MPLTRTKADGTKTTISTQPVKVVLAGVVLYGAYELYKWLLDKEPRILVIASERQRSNVRYLEYNYDLKKWEIKNGVIPYEKHAGQLHYHLNRVGFYETVKPLMEILLDYYTYNDLRLLHNYWVKNIDRDESLYDWVQSYWNFGDADDEVIRVMQKLEAAGVGNVNVIKIPVENYLKK